MLAPSLKQFSLRVEILPSYIPVRVAEKILFVGESVQMFENQNVNLTRKGRNALVLLVPSSEALYLQHWPKACRVRVADDNNDCSKTTLIDLPGPLWPPPPCLP